ncbi:hypothetical protein ABMA28_016455 [Loxostege sticticalis]|uniref:Uncharacterized protein n=1 Tax=Loxostege sticticalis TaxID=481309 RepID=A0ABD0T8X5_LOXSC
MLLLVLCVVSYNVGLILTCKSADVDTEDVFDFYVCPKDEVNGKPRVSFSVKGTIEKHEKVVNIPITVPYCQELVFVRVLVNNHEAPPAVYLDEEYLRVTIRYRPKQDSASSYALFAKTVPHEDCEDDSSSSEP